MGQPHSSQSDQSEVRILGTSSLHDWHSIVEGFYFTAVFANDSILDITGSINPKSIKSGKGIMDSKTYEALQADKFPKILFNAKKLTLASGQYTGQGQLTIVGKTINIPVALTKSATESPIVNGAVTFNMSAFGIDPPTAMFGTLTTGDEVTIEYNIKMTKNSIKQ